VKLHLQCEEGLRLDSSRLPFWPWNLSNLDYGLLYPQYLCTTG